MQRHNHANLYNIPDFTIFLVMIFLFAETLKFEKFPLCIGHCGDLSESYTRWHRLFRVVSSSWRIRLYLRFWKYFRFRIQCRNWSTKALESHGVVSSYRLLYCLFAAVSLANFYWFQCRWYRPCLSIVLPMPNGALKAASLSIYQQDGTSYGWGVGTGEGAYNPNKCSLGWVNF